MPKPVFPAVTWTKVLPNPRGAAVANAGVGRRAQDTPPAALGVALFIKALLGHRAAVGDEGSDVEAHEQAAVPWVWDTVGLPGRSAVLVPLTS